MKNFFDKYILFKWLAITLAVFFIISSLFLLLYFVFNKKFSNKIYPGVIIGQTNVGGLTAERATQVLNKKTNIINQQGIVFKYQDKSVVFYPLISSSDGSLAYSIIDFNIEKTVKSAYAYARTGNKYADAFLKIKALIQPQKFPVFFVLKKEGVIEFLDKNFSFFNNPAKNAALSYSYDKINDSYLFSVLDEKYGQKLNFEKAINVLKNNLAQLKTGPIILKAEIDFPQIKKQDCFNINSKANSLLSLAPIKLWFKDNEWEINKEQLLKWLTLKENKSATNTKDKIIVNISFLTAQSFFKNIAKDIDIEPIEAKFTINNGKVTEFQASKNGRKMNIYKNFNLLQNALVAKKNKFKIIVESVEAQTKTEDINNLGIKEILGIGHSNFAHSPKNRRHNIAVGAATVNGSLIPPGEEFSLIKTLGEIDASTGYLPELVIKDNKTIPEYGGGLCQIGTTMFRGTYESGLPVTMRRNHSYRVSYYEPAGTDATIYNPWPDYRFKNDTANYILIQSRIEGDDLYFEFWGTKDGRIATHTYPVIYNYTKPAPTKIIETTELPVGTKKCTEHAHNGADAYFDYTVIYPNGEEKKTRFRSHYVPWQEICLLGVEKLNTKATATSTTPVNQ